MYYDVHVNTTCTCTVNTTCTCTVNTTCTINTKFIIVRVLSGLISSLEGHFIYKHSCAQSITLCIVLI